MLKSYTNLIYIVSVITLCIIEFNVKYHVKAFGTPPIPKNAILKNITQGPKIEAFFECNTGYTLFGSRSIQINENGDWEHSLPFCAVNIAIGRPTNQSSTNRLGPSKLANDGIYGNNNPDRDLCSETLNEISPWWKIDLLVPETVNALKITTRKCCGYQIQDLEIRVGNSTDVQKNRLCAWFPGTVEEGVTKTFICARPLIGKYVFVQLVGVESSLSLCEVEVFSENFLPTSRCSVSNELADTFVTSFNNKCYEMHKKNGVQFTDALSICKGRGGTLLNNFIGPTFEFVRSTLDLLKEDLKTNLIWIGAKKEEGITARMWKWINGSEIYKPPWGKDQPNNYNGEQNCVVLDGGRNWYWNDVGCNLDYLLFICQYDPVSCGSPELRQNVTVERKNYTVGNSINYKCLNDSALLGPETIKCLPNGVWSGSSPICTYKDCEVPENIVNGKFQLEQNKTTFGSKAVFECEGNYTLLGPKTKQCTLEGWTNEKNSCVLSMCPPLSSPQGGTVKVEGNQYNSKAIYSCDIGYIMFGKAEITCELGGKWSGTPAICKFINCGPAPYLSDGDVVLLNNTTSYGSVAVYSCNEDYLLFGSEELFCGSDGKWVGETPVCELITCEIPSVPTGSFVVGYDYNVNSVIQYYCDPGYSLKGEDSLKCLKTGEWSAEPPTCEYIDCGLIKNFVNGLVSYNANKTYLGSTANFSCDATHKLKGSKSLTCLDTGTWSDAVPHCEEIRCPEPTLAAHSILSVTGNDRMFGRTFIRTSEINNSGQTYKIGAIAKYRCERGYKIVGDSLLTCNESGIWDRIVPECVYVDCGSPSEIQHGKYSLTNNATYYGAVLLYECLPSFKLNGVSRRVCTENGTWSYDEPKCDDILCDDLYNVEFKEITYSNSRRIGSEAKYECSTGKTIIGNSTRVCLPSGNWSGKVPKCEPVDCGLPNLIRNGRVIVINDTTTYSGTIEYHCLPNFVRTGPFLRKCLSNGSWSNKEPTCDEITLKEIKSSNNGLILSISAIVVLLMLLAVFFCL